MANIEVTTGAAQPDAKNPSDRLGQALLVLGAAGALGMDRGDYESLKAELRGLATRDPVDSLLATVLGGGMLFYLLEHGKNPRCNTYWDAVLYVATSLSVGYDDVFPKTDAGNAVAALVQTFGPALAAGAFQNPAAQVEESARAASARDGELLAVNRAILARLDEISASLKGR